MPLVSSKPCRFPAIEKAWHGKPPTSKSKFSVLDQLIVETSAFGDFKYHDSGTGTNGELAADSVLQTPCGEARTIGSQVEGTSKQYKSIATHTYAGGFAITEHGLFNAAAAGILMDRTVFGAINVVATDKIEFTFTITFNSGG